MIKNKAADGTLQEFNARIRLNVEILYGGTELVLSAPFEKESAEAIPALHAMEIIERTLQLYGVPFESLQCKMGPERLRCTDALRITIPSPLLLENVEHLPTDTTTPPV